MAAPLTMAEYGYPSIGGDTGQGRGKNPYADLQFRGATQVGHLILLIYRSRAHLGDIPEDTSEEDAHIKRH